MTGVLSDEQTVISPPGEESWRDVIHELAAFERPSASDGERRAAELIAERFRAFDLPAAIEQEQAHGGYWWPLGLANGIAALGAALALRQRGAAARIAGALAGAAGAAAVWDDVNGGQLRFRRALLRHRPTWNVVATAGDANAERTLIVVAHHDAAHSGLVFHPALGRIGPKLAPRAFARASHTFPIMQTVWGGPLMVLAGASLGIRRVIRSGLVLSLGTVAAMADIGARKAVPGANDNLSAVAVLVALAERLRDRRVEGLRVLLVSTGSEESFMEGMQGFARRHLSTLDPALTEVLCLECLGGPTMLVLEGEGMLVMRDYPVHMREELAGAAREAEVEVQRGLRTVAATDGLISMRAGFPTVTLASIDETFLPLNYHWPSDTPEALHWNTVEQAIEVTECFVRRRAVGGDAT